VNISGEGTHGLSIAVTDIAGNVGNFSSTVNYIFDFTAPLFTMTSVDPISNTPLDFTDPYISWTATDSVAIDYYEMQVNGG
jgi:hypothetical protein